MMLNTNEKLPGIIYSLIARNTVVLVEYSSHEGNFSALAKRILLSIKSHDHKRTYTDKSGRFVFHYMVLDNLTYLCFATKGHKKAVCFAYLNEIYSRFVVAYTEKQILQAVSYTRNFIDFQKVLEREMKRYGKLESIPEPPKFSTPFENSPASNTSFDGNTSHSNYVEMTDFRDSQSVRPNLSRSSTISLLMQENEAVVDHKKKLSSYSEPLLVKSDHTYSDKKIRSRCFYFFFFFLTLLLLVWLISSVACGFDYFCLRNRG